MFFFLFANIAKLSILFSFVSQVEPDSRCFIWSWQLLFVFLHFQFSWCKIGSPGSGVVAAIANINLLYCKSL